MIAAIESSFAKLRLYKIPEFTVASFMLAVLAVVIFLFQPSFGDADLTVFGAAATITAVAVLLLEFGMLRSQDVWEQLRLYSLGSFVVAGLAIATAASGHGERALRARRGDDRAQGAAVPARDPVRAAQSGGRSARAIERRRADGGPARGSCCRAWRSRYCTTCGIGVVPALPLSALPVALAGVFVAFLLMVLRPYAPSQLLGFLVLENAVSVGSLVIAPGLPLILALLLLFDVLVGVLVFVVLVQYLAVERTAVRTDVLDRLTG